MKIKLSVAIGLILTSSAHALPDAQTGNPLPSQVSIPTTIGNILRDHENENTLYVAPSNIKEVVGEYHGIDNGGPSCSKLVNIVDAAYNFPDQSEIQKALESGEYYSNLFQLEVAVPWRKGEMVKKAQEKKIELNKQVLENQAILSRYVKLELQWNDLSNKVKHVNAEKQKHRTIKIESMSECADFIGDNDALDKCKKDVVKNYLDEIRPLNQQARDLRIQIGRIENEYFEIKGQVDAAERRARNLRSDFEFYKSLINFELDSYKTAFKHQDELIKREENRVVGRATAGYNIFTDEISELRKVLAQSEIENYEVAELPIFNIRQGLNAEVVTDLNIESDSSTSIEYELKSYSFPADTLMDQSLLAETNMPFEKEERGDRISFMASTKNSFARAGGFEFLVRKRALCGEPIVALEEYSFLNKDGSNAWKKYSRKKYQPSPDTRVFSQTIGLTYNYYASPGKIVGDCEIDVDRSNSYYRNRGVKTSRGFWSSSTKSWDDTRQTINNELGMSCNLIEKPTSPDPDKSREFVEYFERSMYDDMWQMFLTVYAKSYKVEREKPVVKAIKHKSILGSLGAGVMNLCGDISVSKGACKFTNVVLKSIGELGGSKAKGSTSSVINEYGKIYKRYNKDTWALKEGSTLIKMRVCPSRALCN